MNVLKVKGYIDKYQDYAKAGDAVFADACPMIVKNEMIAFDMSGLDGVSTVFLNTSFGQLIDMYGIERVKRSFKFSNILRSQAERIRKYFSDYSELSMTR